MTSTATSLDPFFLQGVRGRIFCMFVAPDGPQYRGRVLFVPPFAEEMNKCRRQLALQARALAMAGFATLSVDLFGTGDSEGEFGEARWETWVEDLRVAAAWLEQRAEGDMAVIGVRAGALLAADVMARLPEAATRLVLWQPVISGRQHLDQFLRLRVAASLLGPAEGTTVRSLRNELDQGRPLEVAGYEIHPDLAKAMDSRDLQQMKTAPNLRIEWFEVVRERGRTLSIPAQRLISDWKAGGATVTADVIVGDAFWSTVEISVAAGLIDRTTSVIAGG